jgi:hypothetical protein
MVPICSALKEKLNITTFGLLLNVMMKLLHTTGGGITGVIIFL